MKEQLKKSVSTLKISPDILEKMVQNKIETIEDLWKKSRKELKQLGFTDGEIHKIVICLELYGIDLGKRIWKA